MTTEDNQTPNAGGTPSSGVNVSINPDDRGNANLIYILYLISLAVGITSLVGVVMAYIGKDGAPDWLKTHYINQIHIFWKGLAYVVVGVILSLAIVGFLVLLWALIWFIIQNVRGMQRLSRGQPVDKPAGWGI
jgi:uncharacterized membrane protein